MKLRTFFSLLCLTWMVLLSIGLLDVHAEPCASYLSDYLTKLSAYNAADTFLRMQVAVAAATDQLDPSALQEKYDSDPDAFFQNLKDCVSTHPGISPTLGAIVNTLSQLSSLVTLRQALSEAEAAYDSAKTHTGTQHRMSLQRSPRLKPNENHRQKKRQKLLKAHLFCHRHRHPCRPTSSIPRASRQSTLC